MQEIDSSIDWWMLSLPETDSLEERNIVIAAVAKDKPAHISAVGISFDPNDSGLDAAELIDYFYGDPGADSSEQLAGSSLDRATIASKKAASESDVEDSQSERFDQPYVVQAFPSVAAEPLEAVISPAQDGPNAQYTYVLNIDLQGVVTQLKAAHEDLKQINYQIGCLELAINNHKQKMKLLPDLEAQARRLSLITKENESLRKQFPLLQTRAQQIPTLEEINGQLKDRLDALKFRRARKWWHFWSYLG